MKCLHCQENYFPEEHLEDLRDFNEKRHFIVYLECPSCKEVNICHEIYNDSQFGRNEDFFISRQYFYPVSSGRFPAPSEVPTSIGKVYEEACNVLAFSPMASAALSRRCLQQILIDCEDVTKKKNLSQQIDEVLEKNTLPKYLADDLDYIREIGNFAAHSQKSENSGEIVNVEPGEAEANLDILEGLFDFYFVGKSKAEARRTLLNEKLKEVGKKPLDENKSN